MEPHHCNTVMRKEGCEVRYVLCGVHTKEAKYLGLVIFVFELNLDDIVPVACNESLDNRRV